MSDGTCSQNNESINKRISDRNVPSQFLQPYLSVRPVMTKYSIMPIVDPRKRPSVPMNVQPTYNLAHTMNPGDAMSPWSGFASNINLESELRNQVFALQKGSQCVYVPNSTSDMYSLNFKMNPSYTQPFPDLFQTPAHPLHDPNTQKNGGERFHNFTRQQRNEHIH